MHSFDLMRIWGARVPAWISDDTTRRFHFDGAFGGDHIFPSFIAVDVIRIVPGINDLDNEWELWLSCNFDYMRSLASSLQVLVLHRDLDQHD